MKTLSVLHIDDDVLIRDQLEIQLSGTHLPFKFDLISVETQEEFEKGLDATQPLDVILVDLHLDLPRDVNGLALVALARRRNPNALIVVYSNDLSLVGECLDKGADDFIVKGTQGNELAMRIYAAYRLKNDERVDVEDGPESLVVGETMNMIVRRMPRLLGSALRCIHVSGETGTGKEMVADVLASQLPTGTKMVRINCGAIAPQLLESELFGHVKGSFTGAQQDKIGLLERASGGWVFLDELACLPKAAQVALLRVIENQELRRIGDSEVRDIDIKILSAANEPLERLVNEGKFRNDLWQRLAETKIELPPLRDRRDEVDILLDHFCEHETGGPYKLSPEARSVLLQRDWRDGNVRALRNCIRAMSERHLNKVLTPLSIPAGVMRLEDGQGIAAESSRDGIFLSLSRADVPSLTTIQDRALAQTLDYLVAFPEFGQQAKIARALGIAKTTLSSKLKRLDEQGLLGEAARSKLLKVV